MARQVSDMAALLLSFGFDPAQAFGMWQSPEALDGADLVINATSLGMAGQPQLELGLQHLPSSAVVFDLVYATVQTHLISEARRLGLQYRDGLDMLIAQATEGFELFFGAAPPLNPDLDALLRRRLAS
jgi:shikimate dehydrogenase